MSIQATFITLVMRRDVVAREYAGGLAAFHAQYPSCQADRSLLALSVMSTADAQTIEACLSESGLDLDRHVAVIDMVLGLLTAPVKGIRVHRLTNSNDTPQFIVFASGEEEVQDA